MSGLKDPASREGGLSPAPDSKDSPSNRGLCLAIGRTGSGPDAPDAGIPPGGNGIRALFRGRSLEIFARNVDDYAGGLKVAAEFTYYLEGRIYSCTSARLERLLGDALDAESFARCESLIRSFVAGEDGEFLVAAEHRRTGRCLAFNDILGRLPLFQKKQNDRMVLGRSVSAVLSLCGPARPDRLGIASRLLFGYPLDQRTEHEGIESFPESGRVWMDGPQSRPVLSAKELDYGGAASGTRFGGDHGVDRKSIEGLGERLTGACERRIQGLSDLSPTLALSGGFDSRLVACAIRRTGAQIDAVTRTDYLSDPADAVVAAQLAELVGFRHHAIPCGELDPRMMLSLVRMGDGSLGCGLAHMLGFLEHVRDRLGSARFLLTGDGGDKTIAPLLPLGRLSQGGEVLRLLASFSGRERDACIALTGVSKSEIREYVDQSFQNQPGRSAEEKARALAFRQRARRWLNLGEDRNRSVFWSTSPFYAPDFFFMANAIPDAAKQRDRLYLRLLGWFDERVARIPRPGRGRHCLKDWLLLEGHLQLGRSIFLSRVYRSMKPLRAVPKLDAGLADYLQRAKAKGGGVWDICDADILMRQLERPPTAKFRAQLLSLALWGIVRDE